MALSEGLPQLKQILCDIGMGTADREYVALETLIPLMQQAADALESQEKDAKRYRKLRGWMSSNVPEGWTEVERMGAVAAWLSWEDMDNYLDTLPDCNVGLMSFAQSKEEIK